MQVGTTRKSITTADASPPPLVKARHRRIVARHLKVQTEKLPVRHPQPESQLRIFARNDVVAISADCLKRGDPHHHVSAKCLGLPNWRIPLKVAQPVVNRMVRIAFASSAKYGAGLGGCFQERNG